MATSAHNGYVALARQIAGQPKRQHVSVKREEGVLVLKDKENAEATIRALQQEIKQLKDERDRLGRTILQLKEELDDARDAAIEKR